MKKQKVIFIIGGNQGEVLLNIQKATNKLQNLLGPCVLKSEIYRTQAWGPIPQDDFFNQVLVFKTIKTPLQTLRIIHQIEQQLGRYRILRYGPRTIDIDILYFGQKLVNLSNLTIPHPEIQNRSFVLKPLFDCLPKFRHPKFNKNHSELYKLLKDQLKVEKWNK